jgi:hypothetical protein
LTAHRNRPYRWGVIGRATTVSAVVGAVVALAGCGSGSSLGHYSDRTVSFAYPAAWHEHGYRIFVPSTVARNVVFLSSAPMHDPCIRSRHGTRYFYSCSMAPVRRLAPGGVVVSWSSADVPGATLSPAQGTLTEFGGRPAHVLVGRPGPCRRIGGDETVAAVIAERAPHALMTVTGCLRGPDLKTGNAEVRTMLHSVELGRSAF